MQGVRVTADGKAVYRIDEESGEAMIRRANEIGARSTAYPAFVWVWDENDQRRKLTFAADLIRRYGTDNLSE